MSFEEIIDKIKLKPELWQRTHPLYKNKVLRLKIWKQISKELNTDELQVRKSWKYLNDQYRREYKKLKSLGPYEGKPIPCGWAYYEPLSFLMPEMAMRRDRRQMRIPASSDSESATHDASAVTQASCTPESYQQDDNEANYSYEEPMWKYDVAIEQANPALSETSGVTKADLILQHLRTLNATVSKSQSEQLQSDEDYMFFMSILPMVRNLSPLKKLQLRGKINEWLLQTFSGEDPLKNAALYSVPQRNYNEDNKEAVMKQIMDQDHQGDSD